MQRLYGSSHARLGPLAWLALYTGVCIAAEAVTPGGGPRTLEGLTPAAWLLLTVYCLAGWVPANLKPFVIAMNGEDPKAVILASVVTSLIAAFLVGMSAGLWILIEARWDGKPVGALYGYFTAGIGAYGGIKILDLALDTLKAFAIRWAERAERNGGGS